MSVLHTAADLVLHLDRHLIELLTLYGAWIYAILFLAPDLSVLAYLGGPKLGALVYNALHTTIFPLAARARDSGQACHAGSPRCSR